MPRANGDRSRSALRGDSAFRREAEQRGNHEPETSAAVLADAEWRLSGRLGCFPDV